MSASTIALILCSVLPIAVSQTVTQTILSTDTRIRYNGSWSVEDGLMSTSEQGASASLAFNGTICNVSSFSEWCISNGPLE